jgi:hypothetical protein
MCYNYIAHFYFKYKYFLYMSPQVENFTLTNRCKPEILKTNREFLNEVIIRNETGRNLTMAEPRWAMAFDREQETKEEFEDRNEIIPELFQTPGIRRDQEQNQYSDAVSEEHLKIVGMLADDYNNKSMFNQKEMLGVLDMRDRRDMPQLLTLSGLFHDYHEGNEEIGDRVDKTPDFKLLETLTMWTDTVENMKSTYRDLLQEQDLEASKKESLIKENDLLFEKMFLVLASDPKLSEKYGITTSDLVGYFKENGLSKESQLLFLANQGKYKDIAETLEMLHQISFLMAAISMEPIDENDIKTKALKFEATARSFGELKKIIETSKDGYLSNFVLTNQDKIASLIMTGNDINIQKELVRNGRNIINPNNLLND